MRTFTSEVNRLAVPLPPFILVSPCLCVSVVHFSCGFSVEPSGASRMEPALAQSWHLLQTGPHPAAENMALDEALLEAAPQRAAPVLRFYSWSEPAATFGYFQHYADVARMTSLRPLVRRPTGGGLVPHDADWTYSLIFPPEAPWYELKAVESYRRLHAWIQAAFGRAGVTTELAPAPRQAAVGQCFIGAERFDLLWNERKIAGAAQRRTRHGLLIQGSVQPPPGLPRADWENALCDVACAQWGVVWSPLVMDPDLSDRGHRLATEKYGRSEYQQRR